MNNEDKLTKLISNGAELAGSATSGALTFLAATGALGVFATGSIGSAAGVAMGGTVITKAFIKIG